MTTSAYDRDIAALARVANSAEGYIARALDDVADAGPGWDLPPEPTLDDMPAIPALSGRHAAWRLIDRGESGLSLSMKAFRLAVVACERHPHLLDLNREGSRRRAYLTALENDADLRACHDYVFQSYAQALVDRARHGQEQSRRASNLRPESDRRGPARRLVAAVFIARPRLLQGTFSDLVAALQARSSWGEFEVSGAESLRQGAVRESSGKNKLRWVGEIYVAERSKPIQASSLERAFARERQGRRKN